MGGIGQCCCTCCLASEDIPFSQVTLKAPFDNCGGYGPPAEFPSFALNQSDVFGCCYLGNVNFSCQTPTTSCKVYAKRKTDWSFKVEYYRSSNCYLPAGSDWATDCGNQSVCRLIQTKTVDATTSARVFFKHTHELINVEITVGKAQIKCNGDTDPVCKYFIAATWYYRTYESISSPIYYRKFDFVCTGNFEVDNCSMSTSWTVQNGSDSDSCPGDGYFGGGTTKVVKFTRAKFYDTLPTGEVTITKDDKSPFSCCGGKTNCEVFQSTCGLDFSGDRCVAPLPPYPEGKDRGTPNAVALLDVCTNGAFGEDAHPGPLWWDDTNQPHCLVVHENGLAYVGVYNTANECLVYKPAPGSGCYERRPDGLATPCYSTIVGFDRFAKLNSGDPGRDEYDMCNTLALAGTGDPLGTYACGDPLDPPLGGLCEIPDCCEILNPLEPNISACHYVAGYCGRKISDYTCATNKTDYTVGDVCFELPNVTIELT